MRRKVLVTNGRAPECIDDILGHAKQEEFDGVGAITDARITNVGTKWWVCQGDDALAFVTVCNEGTCRETVDLTLEGTVMNITIGTRTVSLPPQATQVIIFRWETNGFGIGEHFLHAQVKPNSQPSENLQSPRPVTSERASREAALAEVYKILRLESRKGF